MPRWLRRLFSSPCEVCAAKDAELQRVYVLLADATQDIRDLTKQLLVREAQAPVKPQPRPVVARQATRQVPQGEGDIPAYINSLYSGGHLEASIEELQKRQLDTENATVSGMGQ